jgi:hypothetical protein
MEVRPFLTAGVAIASAGVLVAALPAIAPPLATKDVKVYADPNMRLAADLEELINVFFKSAPGDPDAPGTIGFPGIVFQLLRDANEGDARGQAVIDAFFESGASEVVRLLLTRDNADPITVAQINTFFEGGFSELVRFRLLMFNADPTQRAWINKFFGGAVNDDGSTNVSQQGFPGTFYKFLSERGLSPDQQAMLDRFFNRGVLRTEPDLTTPDPDDVIPVLDEEGLPVYDGYSNPALKGFPGLVYDGLTNSGLSPDQQQTLDDLFVNGGFTPIVQRRLVESTADPTQRLQINRFFEGGATKLVGDNLLDANGDPTSPQYQAIDSFFYGYPFGDDRGPAGFTGLVHFIIDNLMGNVPPPAPIMAANVLAADASEGLPPVNEPPSNGPAIQMRVSAPPAPGDVVDDLVDGAESTAQALGSPAPIPQAAPAPVAAPAPAPAPVSNEEEGDDAKEVTEEEMKSGNKAELPLILLQNGGAGGGSAWENESLPRWRDAAARLGFGGGAPAPAPSAPEAGDGGDAGAEAGAEG